MGIPQPARNPDFPDVPRLGRAISAAPLKPRPDAHSETTRALYEDEIDPVIRRVMQHGSFKGV